MTFSIGGQHVGGIFYYISKGNGDHKLRINEASGQIIFNRPLDRELTARYTLTTVGFLTRPSSR